jgi:hypothetical protein
MTVADTIAQQIGRRALFMLGAKNLINHGSALSFRIRGSKAANYIKITLTPMDLYDMEFGKIRGHNYKIVATDEGVYSDMLNDIITERTGLYTQL